MDPPPRGHSTSGLRGKYRTGPNTAQARELARAGDAQHEDRKAERSPTGDPEADQDERSSSRHRPLDTDEWAARRTPEGCTICKTGGPLNVIAELETCWATAGREAALPAYVCVVARHHYNEPFEMPPDEQGRFWQEAMRVASAVNRAVQPIKMNYEIHGNTLPHLHLHLFPRQADDPYGSGPVDPRKASFVRTDEELERLADAIRAAAG